MYTLVLLALPVAALAQYGVPAANPPAYDGGAVPAAVPAAVFPSFPVYPHHHHHHNRHNDEVLDDQWKGPYQKSVISDPFYTGRRYKPRFPRYRHHHHHNGGYGGLPVFPLPASAPSYSGPSYSAPSYPAAAPSYSAPAYPAAAPAASYPSSSY